MTEPSASPVSHRDNLVWIDLEMSGLDPQTQVILQAAVIITDKDLTPLAEQAWDVWQPQHKLQNMSPFVRDMHQTNGLLERSAASTSDVADVERQLLATITQWCPFPGTLCGNSIWCDRKFLDRYMPALSGYLGHRMVDVSSIKVLAGKWYGDAAVFNKPVAGAHDALVDIRNSIAELRHYRQSLFKS